MAAADECRARVRGSRGPGHRRQRRDRAGAGRSGSWSATRAAASGGEFCSSRRSPPFTGGIVGPHYAASKAALHGLTHYLASRYAPDGVTVNALAPALITETGMLPGEPEELRERIPLRRLGQPDEVADLALAILRIAYVTNQVISIDGGMHPR